MPPKCQKCGNVIKGNDGICTNCGPDVMDVALECPACAKLTTGVCQPCFDKIRMEEVGQSITKLQEAKTRIRSAPSRSGSGAEPPAPKKPNGVEPPPSPTLPKKDEKVPSPASPPKSPSEPPSPRGSSSNPTLDAILALTLKMEMLSVQSDKIEKKIGGMATKEDLGKMQKGLVSKVDLQNMEAAISKNTKIHIAEAVDPIKSEICDLRQRVNKIEDTGGSNPV